MADLTLETLAILAEKALFYEVALTPKPGLVDRISNGAHTDMNFFTFIDSITSLSPFFKRYLQAGFTHQGDCLSLFTSLRKIGIQAEAAMLQATKGINTHKGANFSFAVVLGATGYYLHTKPALPFTKKDSEAILKIVQEMTDDLLQNDFATLQEKSNLSYGEELYLKEGLTGIRGEAAKGYPTLQETILPFLRQQHAENQDSELVLLRTLIYLMSFIEDGNLIHRGGIPAWQQVQAECREIHQRTLSKEEFLDELYRYNQLLIQRHLSPGGAADLLALAIFFAFLEGLF